MSAPYGARRCSLPRRGASRGALPHLGLADVWPPRPGRVDQRDHRVLQQRRAPEGAARRPVSHAVCRHRVHLVRRCAAYVGRGDGASAETSSCRTCSSPLASCTSRFSSPAQRRRRCSPASVEFSDGDIDPVVAHQFPQFGSHPAARVRVADGGDLRVCHLDDRPQVTSSCPTGSRGAVTRSVSFLSAQRLVAAMAGADLSRSGCVLSGILLLRARGAVGSADADPGDGDAAVRFRRRHPTRHDRPPAGGRRPIRWSGHDRAVSLTPR